jgi:hypothetical protein
MKVVEYLFRDISRRYEAFEVTGVYADGSERLLGRVEHRFFRHLSVRSDRSDGFFWEATAADGSHRAVHEERWQAAWALAWDGIGYPFPVHPRHRPT